MRGLPSTCWSRATPRPRRQLVREKDRLRDREKETSQSHFVRLRDGTAKSVETSSIHLDTIRDLKQINSLLASMAYPVLEERGPADGVAAEGRLIRRGRDRRLSPSARGGRSPRCC